MKKIIINALMKMGILSLLVLSLGAAQPSAPPALATPASPSSSSPQIAGTVMEIRSGTPDVVVLLCDQETGLPLSAATRRPFIDNHKQNNNNNIPSPDLDLLTTTTDARGQFAFTNIPPGRYRLIAQKWIGPFKGIFKLNGSVIQFFGTADNIEVPSEKAKKVVLTPPGRGVASLDMDVGNDGTFLFLSAAPTQFDPILGFHAMGRPFLRALIGGNLMPSGRTTIIGLPDRPVHAFFFANDNSPGFAAQTLTPQLAAPIPKIPFVAGWSDGRHDPPADIEKIMNTMEKHNIKIKQYLEPRTPAPKNYWEALAGQPLDRQVKLPGGTTCRLGDLFAADSYRRMREYRKGGR